MHHALTAVYHGESPDALDLRYRTSPDPESMARFWAEATGRKPFTVSNIVGMDHHDRSFAETVLISRLRYANVNALKPLWALDVPGWSAHVRAAIPFIEEQPVVKRAYEAALVAAPN